MEWRHTEASTQGLPSHFLHLYAWQIAFLNPLWAVLFLPKEFFSFRPRTLARKVDWPHYSSHGRGVRVSKMCLMSVQGKPLKDWSVPSPATLWPGLRVRWSKSGAGGRQSDACYAELSVRAHCKVPRREWMCSKSTLLLCGSKACHSSLDGWPRLPPSRSLHLSILHSTQAATQLFNPC